VACEKDVKLQLKYTQSKEGFFKIKMSVERTVKWGEEILLATIEDDVSYYQLGETIMTITNTVTIKCIQTKQKRIPRSTEGVNNKIGFPVYITTICEI
jgi:hypothetical protein